MDLSIILPQIIVLYILMVIGMIVNRVGVINDSVVSGITKIILYVTIPATIFASLKDSAAITNQDAFEMAGLSLLTYALVFVLSFVVLVILFVHKPERPFYQYICIFGNIGFIGYPMVTAVIGSQGVLLAAIANIFYSVLLYTAGIYLMSQNGENDSKVAFQWKRMVNPGMIAAILCVLMFVFKIPLPGVLSETADLLGGATTPLAMLVVGASVNKIDFKSVIKNYRIIIISVVKMTAYPIGFAYLIKALGFTGLPAMVSVLLLGMPVATTSVITAMEFNRKNLAKASVATVLSTIMLIVTIPVLVFAVSIVTG